MSGSLCTECSDDTGSRSVGSVSSKTAAAPIASASGTSAIPAHKKPVKLDIAAILEADSSPAAADPAAPVPGSEPASDIKEAAPPVSSAKDKTAADISAQADRNVSPAVILLLILCVILGLGILCTIILIIWPNVIPTLFYHSQI